MHLSLQAASTKYFIPKLLFYEIRFTDLQKTTWAMKTS